MDGTDPIVAHVARLRAINRRPASIRQREYALRHLERFGAPAGILELAFETVRAFTDRASLGPEARNASISHVRGFYRWAAVEGLIGADPSGGLERPRRARRLPRPMPTSSVVRALESAPDPIRQWLFLATYAGLRACEIAQLSGSDFVLERTPPMVIIQEQKGGDTGYAVIAPPLFDVAAELAVARGWCFVRGEGDPSGRLWGGHVTAHQVSSRMNRFLHESGIPQTAHQLRHWFGTETNRVSGGRFRVVQEAMRHRSPSSTAIYTLVEQSDIAEALDLLPRLTA